MSLDVLKEKKTKDVQNYNFLKSRIPKFIKFLIIKIKRLQFQTYISLILRRYLSKTCFNAVNGNLTTYFQKSKRPQIEYLKF
jgi:hypothetical protein